MSEQPGLFPEPEPVRVRPPRRLERVDGKPRYTSYRTARRTPCDDCARVTYEQLMDGQAAPMLRAATVKRTQGGVQLLLCGEHAEQRKAAEKVREAER